MKPPEPTRKTKKSFNDPGHAHFLTYSCTHRWPLLSKDRTRRWVIEAMEAARREQNLQLWAYVIMPEHVHLLLYPSNADYKMKYILTALKRPVSDNAAAFLKDTGKSSWLEKLTVHYPSRSVFRFWQPGGGYDCNIFREKTVKEVIEYIHGNPVRRGLVYSPSDWIWSSARFWEGAAEVPIRMDEPFL